MGILKYLYNNDSLKRKILNIRDGIMEIVRNYSVDTVSIIQYGAYDIDPKHLVYWVCVKTDQQKNILQNNADLSSKIRYLLVKYDYPVEARDYVYFGFESQESVDRESGGNWHTHFQ